MLDDIAVGPFLEQPAGKDAAPFILAIIKHDQLDEGTGFRRGFPLGRPFAGAQANNGAAYADAFAGLERDVTNQPVALVEQAEDGDPFGHGRDAGERI